VSTRTSLAEFDLVILGGGTGGDGRCLDSRYTGAACRGNRARIRWWLVPRTSLACPVRMLFTARRWPRISAEVKSSAWAKRDFTVDMRVVRERKRRMVSGWNDVYLENYKKTGAEFILGFGRFIGAKTLEAKLADGRTRQLRASNVIINTGTHAAIEPIPGLADAEPSHISKHWNWMKFPNIFSFWEAGI